MLIDTKYDIGELVNINCLVNVPRHDARRHVCKLYNQPVPQEELKFQAAISRITYDSSRYVPPGKRLAFNVVNAPAHAPGTFYLDNLSKIDKK